MCKKNQKTHIYNKSNKYESNYKEIQKQRNEYETKYQNDWINIIDKLTAFSSKNIDFLKWKTPE